MTPEEIAKNYSIEVIEAAIEISGGNKIDLTKIPTDVLEMSIKMRENNLEKERGDLTDDEYIIKNWHLLSPDMQKGGEIMGICPNKKEIKEIKPAIQTDEEEKIDIKGNDIKWMGKDT